MERTLTTCFLLSIIVLCMCVPVCVSVCIFGSKARKDPAAYKDEGEGRIGSGAVVVGGGTTTTTSVWYVACGVRICIRVRALLLSSSLLLPYVSCLMASIVFGLKLFVLGVEAGEVLPHRS